MKRQLFRLILATLSMSPWMIAHAEKGDADKNIEIEADKACVVDEVKQVRTCDGNVVMIQGTLIMKGTKLVVKTSPDGWQNAILYAPGGGKATMRQKRDGGPDLWMEGEAAEHITYDQKTAVATLVKDAKVRRLSGSKTTDESEAAYLSYDSNTEIVTGTNSADGTSKPGDKRVKITIQPHAHNDAKDK